MLDIFSVLRESSPLVQKKSQIRETKGQEQKRFRTAIWGILMITRKSNAPTPSSNFDFDISDRLRSIN
jgi:hypothetical protein